MNRAQRYVVLVTAIVLAVVLQTTFLDWNFRNGIIFLKPDDGLTVNRDMAMFLGAALPVIVVGAALWLFFRGDPPPIGRSQSPP